MSSIAVVGLQWGDEGKGKIVDLLSEESDAVVRFQGGHNAGHTIIVKGQKRVLHLIPSGVLRPAVECLIGSGVVLSIPALIEEIDSLAQFGIDIVPQLKISPLCPLIFTSHCQLDAVNEMMLHSRAIGTTGRGIGPAYEDQVGRRALRLHELHDPDSFADRMKELFKRHNLILEECGHTAADWQPDYDFIMRNRDLLLRMMHPIPNRLKQLKEEGKNILFEGAQGALLDIDHGTYPFVTSSHTLAGHIACGAGFPVRLLSRVVGVCKAYTTRVGHGPFPTESQGATGEHLAQRGNEFGATTGRPRRCGWLDLVTLRRMVWLNDADTLCLTKLDVLTGLDCVRVCKSYKDEAIPFAGGEPEYIEFDGWGEPLTGIDDYDDLPLAVRKYIEYIERQVGVPVAVISTGPRREENIIRTKIF